MSDETPKDNSVGSMSRMELGRMIFGCSLAALIVGHLIWNGEKPAVDGHFMTLTALIVLFVGVAFTGQVVALLQAWRGKKVDEFVDKP